MAELVGWRVVKEKHAAGAFSGEGARLFGGRWNSAGVKVVYCSENLALASLEILVHTRLSGFGQRFRAFSVTFDSSILIAIDQRKLEPGWDAEPPLAASRRVGDEWVRSARSAVLALPSVLVPMERTYLLNPAHGNFPKIKVKSVASFMLDPRVKA